MKIAALVLGLLGSLILLGVGALWTDNAEHLQEVEQAAKLYDSVASDAAAAGQPVADKDKQDMAATLATVRGKARASYPMAVAGLVAFVASFLVFKLPKVAAAVMAAAVLVPAALYWGSFFVGLLLAIAALLAFLAKPKPRAAVAA
jgi:hypothetical protein